MDGCHLDHAGVLEGELDGGGDDVHLLDVELGDEFVLVAQVGRHVDGLVVPLLVCGCIVLKNGGNYNYKFFSSLTFLNCSNIKIALDKYK